MVTTISWQIKAGIGENGGKHQWHLNEKRKAVA